MIDSTKTRLKRQGEFHGFPEGNLVLKMKALWQIIVYIIFS